MNQVKTVFVIQVLHSFTGGVFAVALPLMMEARNINVVLIGLVFASMPLVMQIGRMFFATVSDFWGRKLFFASNGLLTVVSGLIYYFARSPLEFLFGKVTEGTREGTLWAVNRAFLLEKSERKLTALLHLRAIVYAAYAVGSLVLGFLVIWFAFEGTMLLCSLIGGVGIILSLLLVGARKERFNMEKAMRFLDFRKKNRIFKAFLGLFLVMGMSFGFVEGFVFPLFLSTNGYSAEIIGFVIGVQTLLAGLFSYVFSKTSNVRGFILLGGVLFSATFLLLGFSSFLLAVALVLFYGVVQGIAAVGQEGILARITDEASYGTDIGLLMFGLHVGESVSLALSGFLIAAYGFAAPFLLAASTYVVFYMGSYVALRE